MRILQTKIIHPPVNKADKVIKNLRLDHLKPEEKDHVLEIENFLIIITYKENV